MTHGKRKRILILEDDEDIGRAIKVHLEAQGFEVHHETLGEKAILYAAEHHPDLAILDLRLPDISGYEVCRELRRLYRPWTIPVVMLTGMARPLDKVKGFGSGSDAYLTKPCDLRELSRTVKALLDETLAA
jgi:DNA-binding response OmpR family regulator